MDQPFHPACDYAFRMVLCCVGVSVWTGGSCGQHVGDHVRRLVIRLVFPAKCWKPGVRPSTRQGGTILKEPITVEENAWEPQPLQ